jgi:hypothetical protein
MSCVYCGVDTTDPIAKHHQTHGITPERHEALQNASVENAAGGRTLEERNGLLIPKPESGHGGYL